MSFGFTLLCIGRAETCDRHSAEELEAMDEDEDAPPPVPKLDRTPVNGA